MVMRYLVCCLLCLSFAAAVRADEPADGIYAAHPDGDGRRVRRNDGAFIVLGQPLGTGFGTARIESVTNDNSRFVLQMKNAGPVAAGLKPGHVAVVIDGICLGIWGQSDQHPDGTIDLSAGIDGEQAARKVAARLKVQPQVRKNPGHRFEVRWKPEKEEYRAGDPVKLTMEIRNTGDAPFSFGVGGKQRGPRDNQYRFLAYHSYGEGKALPDTGDPTNFGGIGGLRTLKPGETFTATVEVTKWFTFTDPDIYRITGIFELHLHDPAKGFDRPIWDDLAVGQCHVKIVPKE
jgi:archaellum component FlaG (FlaF/FlaG flagellin family)